MCPLCYSLLTAADLNSGPFQFLCYQNIKLFLDRCQHHFLLRDLFEPPMLYDLSNFHRVLLTLSKLSQCRKVQTLHPDLL